MNPDISPSTHSDRMPESGGGLPDLRVAHLGGDDSAAIDPDRSAGSMPHESAKKDLPDAWLACMVVVRSQVKPRHWEIFEAYVMEDQSSRQVAHRFGTTPYNVRIIAYRIRNKVRRHRESLARESVSRFLVDPSTRPGVVAG